MATERQTVLTDFSDLKINAYWFPYKEGFIGVMEMTNEDPALFSIKPEGLAKLAEAHRAVVDSMSTEFPKLENGRTRKFIMIANFGNHTLGTFRMENPKAMRSYEWEKGFSLQGYTLCLKRDVVSIILQLLTTAAGNPFMKIYRDFDKAMEMAKKRLDVVL